MIPIFSLFPQLIFRTKFIMLIKTEIIAPSPIVVKFKPLTKSNCECRDVAWCFKDVDVELLTEWSRKNFKISNRELMINLRGFCERRLRNLQRNVVNSIKSIWLLITRFLCIYFGFFIMWCHEICWKFNACIFWSFLHPLNPPSSITLNSFGW